MDCENGCFSGRLVKILGVGIDALGYAARENTDRKRIPAKWIRIDRDHIFAFTLYFAVEVGTAIVDRQAPSVVSSCEFMQK